MEIDTNDPVYIEYKKVCQERREKWFAEIAQKHNLDIDYVRKEMQKGPFSGSPILELVFET